MDKLKKNAPQKLLKHAGIHCPHHKRLKLSASSVAWVATIHRYGPLPSICAHCSSRFWTKCSWPSTMTYSFQYFQNSMFNCDGLVFGEKLIYICFSFAQNARSTIIVFPATILQWTETVSQFAQLARNTGR